MIDPPEIIGPRLKALRKALGYKTQIAFAKSIGVEKQTYNPWETGARPLTFEAACSIHKNHRIPLDYLFFGEQLDQLPAKVHRELMQAA